MSKLKKLGLIPLAVIAVTFSAGALMAGPPPMYTPAYKDSRSAGTTKQEMKKPEIEKPKIEKPKIEKPEMKKPDMENPEMKKPDMEKPEEPMSKGNEKTWWEW